MKTRQTITTAFVIVVMGALAAPSYGQLLMNPLGGADRGKMEGALGLGFFKADYEFTEPGESSEGDIERSFVFGSLTYGINDLVDIVVGSAFTFKSEIHESSVDDTGYMIGGGIRARVWQKQASAIHAYGQVSYIDEDYGKEPETETRYAIDQSASGIELLLGALYVHSGDGFKFYGGAELAPYADLDLNVVYHYGDGYGDESEDLGSLERADIFSAKLGAQVDVGSALLQADATFIGEETFRVSVVMPF